MALPSAAITSDVLKNVEVKFEVLIRVLAYDKRFPWLVKPTPDKRSTQV